MKDYIKVLFYAGIPFGITMGIFMGIFKGIYEGVFSGIIMGFLFGTGISIFVHIQKEKIKKISSSITEGKEIIMDGGANNFKGKEAVGGWLYLTSEEIIFKSHAFNIQTHKTIIPLSKIVEVKAVNTFGLIPNGLQIKSNDSMIEKFVVYNRKAGVERIKFVISSNNVK